MRTASLVALPGATSSAIEAARFAERPHRSVERPRATPPQAFPGRTSLERLTSVRRIAFGCLKHPERRVKNLLGVRVTHVGSRPHAIEPSVSFALAEAECAQCSKRLGIRVGYAGIHDRPITCAVGVAKCEAGRDPTLDFE